MNFKDAKIGIEVATCENCNKQKIGTMIYEYFKPEPFKISKFITYRDGICYINGQVLMSLIRMANPNQQDREIKVVSAVEFRNIISGKGD